MSNMQCVGCDEYSNRTREKHFTDKPHYELWALVSIGALYTCTRRYMYSIWME